MGHRTATALANGEYEMKIKIYTFISDGQDGTADVKYFPTADEAQAAEDEELKQCGQTFMDATGFVIIDTNDFETVEDAQ